MLHIALLPFILILSFFNTSSSEFPENFHISRFSFIFRKKQNPKISVTNTNELNSMFELNLKMSFFYSGV